MKPNIGDLLGGNVEKRMFVYLFLTIRNTAIDQGASICKTMAPGIVFTPANGLEINIV